MLLDALPLYSCRHDEVIKCACVEINQKRYKQNHKYEQIPDAEAWKVPLLRDLVEMRREIRIYRELDSVNAGVLNLDEINHNINEICTN